MARGQNAKSERWKERRTRKSNGGFQTRLDAPEKDGMHRRWVNDDPGRIARMQERDYEIVTTDGTSAFDSERTDAQGAQLAREVGGGKRAYLMEKPIEWRDEDVAAAQQQIDAKEDSIFRRKEIQSGGESLSGDPTAYVAKATIRRGT